MSANQAGTGLPTQAPHFIFQHSNGAHECRVVDNFFFLFLFSPTQTSTHSYSDKRWELQLPRVHSIFLSPLKWNGSNAHLLLPFMIAFFLLGKKKLSIQKGRCTDFILYSNSEASIRNSGLLSGLHCWNKHFYICSLRLNNYLLLSNLLIEHECLSSFLKNIICIFLLLF